MKKTVAFFTLGCRVNQYETAAMEAIFTDAGYEVVSFEEPAAVYIINTCAVTAESERKCRQVLRRAKRKNPDAVVAAVGCMVQASKDEVLKMDEVDVVVGVSQKHNILEAVEKAMLRPCFVDDMSTINTFREMKISDFEDRDRAFVKIQDGCDRFCSYCIIPYLRGRVRSRAPEDILDEIKMLSKKGFQEVVLTGIHVASFGRGTDFSLSNLICHVADIPSIQRIRLSSIDVAAFTDELLKTYQNIEKLCPQFHISLQSGSTSVLKRMNRRYTAEEYAAAVEKLRSIRSDTAITTDIITGFPGETEAEFAETMAFVEKVNLSGIHVFPYSIRQGTAAAKMTGQLPKKVRDERAKILIEKASALRHTYANQFVGTVQPVLFEHKNGEASGFTPHYLRVVVPDCKDASSLYGKISHTEIYDCEGEILYGKL